jgi:tRNA uridine 5-carbamoylmethylation protein Kti12
MNPQSYRPIKRTNKRTLCRCIKKFSPIKSNNYEKGVSIMATLTIIRGLPGSGKSTYAKSLLKKGVKHFEADMFHTHKGVYDYNISKARQGHEWCLNKTLEALESGRSVIVSNTFTTYYELSPYICGAKELGVDVRIIACTGEFESEHGVPDSTLEQMKCRWEDVDGEEFYDPDEQDPS